MDNLRAPNKIFIFPRGQEYAGRVSVLCKKHR